MKTTEQKIIHGDCIEEMKKLLDNSVDAVVTDPPYGLSFMGKKWDSDVPSVEVWKEVFRNKNIQVLIPNKKFDFTGKKNCWFATAWFCWKMNLPNQLNFRKVLQSNEESK